MRRRDLEGLSGADVERGPAYNRPGLSLATADELAALVDSRRPDVIALVGVIALLLLLWLMMFKPF